MKIAFDRTRCTGHGRCYSLGPDLFDEDEDGYCVVTTPRPGPELLEQARAAVANCPEQALGLEEDDV